DVKDVRLVFTKTLLKAYETRAQQYAAADKWQRVRDTYTEIRRLDPTAAGPSYERGKASGAMGDYPQALADFTGAIGPGAAPPEYYEARGDLHIRWAGKEGKAAREKGCPAGYGYRRGRTDT